MKIEIRPHSREATSCGQRCEGDLKKFEGCLQKCEGEEISAHQIFSAAVLGKNPLQTMKYCFDFENIEIFRGNLHFSPNFSEKSRAQLDLKH